MNVIRSLQLADIPAISTAEKSVLQQEVYSVGNCLHTLIGIYADGTLREDMYRCS